MTCSVCDHENRDGARFCEACGERLPQRCEGCGNRLRDGAAFCDGCGRPVAAELSARAERRQLTVMFCDLVGSTQLAQGLDPEDLREVVGRYHREASKTVERYGGHVAQFLGDGLLAYFGYPHASENDGERSVRAALDILDEIERANEDVERDYRVRLAARIGIHTGPVVIGEVGGGERRERLALGDTTNIAARLEGSAEPGSVFISDATHALVGGLFIARDQGYPELKGVASRVRAYQIVRPSGVRSRIEGSVRLTPLAGRTVEVGVLLDRWERAQDGLGQVVQIVGEAGLGKSRLMQVLRRHVGGTPHTWLEARCSAHTQASALQPVIELTKHGLGFEEADSAEVRLSKLEQGLELADLRRAEPLALLAALHELPLPDTHTVTPTGPERSRQRTFQLLADWTLALAKLQPVILVFEDLHWSDPSTLELLALLRERCATAPLLVVLTFRPQFEPEWKPLGHATEIALERLGPRLAREMVESSVGEAELSSGIVDRIVARADGVPLFVEELTKMVRESGVESEDEVPMTLQDSLMARLDRLGPAKEVAQRAAVLGREFSHQMLAAVSGEEDAELCRSIERLVDAELLYQRGTPPYATYVFKHALVLDVAYQSLLRRTRQQLHQRIAAVLEERFPSRIEMDPALLALHLDRGGDATRASECYRAAAQRAGELSANAEAEQQLQRALKLLADLPDGDERDRAELALQNMLGIISMRMRGYADDASLPAFERALTLARSLAENEARVVALVGLSAYRQNRAEHASAIELAEEIVTLGSQTQTPLFKLAGHGLISPPAFYAGDLERALEESRSALLHYEGSSAGTFTSINDFGVAAHGFAAWSATLLGYPDQGIRSAAAGVELAEKLDHAFSIAFAYVFHAATHAIRNEPGPARVWAERAIELAEELRFPLWLGLGRALRGWAEARDGDVAGIAMLNEGLATASQTGSQAGAPLLLALHGQANLAIGDLETAAATIEGAIQIAAATGQHFADALLYCLRGEIAASSGRGDQADEAFGRAIELARTRGAHLLELRACNHLTRRRGEPASNGSELGRCFAWFQEGFDAPDLVEARALLDASG